MLENSIFIPGNTPSSKNSKQWVWRGKRGFLVNSKTTTKYIKSSTKDYQVGKNLFKKMIDGLPKPYIIGMHFVRKTKQRFDFSNLVQVVQDQAVRHDWLSDDNINEMFPLPFKIDGKWYSVDKDKPGVYIKVFTDMELKYQWINASVWKSEAEKLCMQYPLLDANIDMQRKINLKQAKMTANEYKKKYGKSYKNRNI